MSRYIILSPDAKADIRSATRWYENKGIDLSLRFTAETEVIFNRIALYPLQFPLVHKLIRRAVMKEFPYCIYFTVKKYSVSVIAVLHQHRGNSIWMNRDNGRAH